jgi:hypothetical protein
MSKYISKCRAVANFNAYIEKMNKSTVKKQLTFPFEGFGLCFMSLYQMMEWACLANTNLTEHFVLL